jgi:hypothetical protein
MHLAPSKHTLTEKAPPPFCAGRKLSDIDKALLWNILHEDPACPTRALLDKVAHMQITIAVSVRHRNRLRATWQRPRRKGRLRHVACSAAAEAGRWSRSRRICRMWACIFVPIGSISRMPLGRWWPGSSRRLRPRSAHGQQTTLPCCIIVTRRCVAALRPCFLRPCVASSASPRWIPTSIRFRRCLAGASTAPR